jgi:hypothetical protein
MDRQVIIRTTLPSSNTDELLCVGHYYKHNDEDDADDRSDRLLTGLVFEDYKPDCTAVAIYHEEKTMPWGNLKWYRMIRDYT